jgi:TolA-binding protein
VAAPPSDDPTGSGTAAAPVGEIATPAQRPAASGAAAGSARASSAPAASAESPEEARVRALYRAAHQAHFVAQDWGTALSAWDRYLESAPRGAFAAEARYNRALCLVRLGRAGEAQAALEPFARGAFGEYRRAEATRLLEALGGR